MRVCVCTCICMHMCRGETKKRGPALRGGKRLEYATESSVERLAPGLRCLGREFRPELLPHHVQYHVLQVLQWKNKTNAPREGIFFAYCFFFFFQTIQRFFDIESRNLGFYERWFGIRFELLTYINKVVFSATDHTWQTGPAYHVPKIDSGWLFHSVTLVIFHLF